MKFAGPMTLFVCASLFAACATKHTNDQYAKDYLNRCYSTRLESIFLSRDCGRGTWTYCDTAIPILPDVHVKGWNYPPTLRAFCDDPDGWSRRIHENERRGQPGLAPDNIVIYGGLPIHTTLKMVELVSQFDGENGARWMPYAEILDGEFKGRRVLLPNGNLSPVDWDFLERCEVR
jgi:hypothetical protein